MSQSQVAASSMRTVTGKLVVMGGTIAVQDGPTLALCDESDPIAAAVTAYGDSDGETATVTGSDGKIGGLTVLCVTALVLGDAGANSVELTGAVQPATAAAAKPIVVKTAAPKTPKKLSTRK